MFKTYLHFNKFINLFVLICMYKIMVALLYLVTSLTAATVVLGGIIIKFQSTFSIIPITNPVMPSTLSIPAIISLPRFLLSWCLRVRSLCRRLVLWQRSSEEESLSDGSLSKEEWSLLLLLRLQCLLFLFFHQWLLLFRRFSSLSLRLLRCRLSLLSSDDAVAPQHNLTSYPPHLLCLNSSLLSLLHLLKNALAMVVSKVPSNLALLAETFRQVCLLTGLRV